MCEEKGEVSVIDTCAVVAVDLFLSTQQKKDVTICVTANIAYTLFSFVFSN